MFKRSTEDRRRTHPVDLAFAALWYDRVAAAAEVTPQSKEDFRADRKSWNHRLGATRPTAASVQKAEERWPGTACVYDTPLRLLLRGETPSKALIESAAALLPPPGPLSWEELQRSIYAAALAIAEERTKDLAQEIGRLRDYGRRLCRIRELYRVHQVFGEQLVLRLDAWQAEAVRQLEVQDQTIRETLALSSGRAPSSPSSAPAIDATTTLQVPVASNLRREAFSCAAFATGTIDLAASFLASAPWQVWLLGLPAALNLWVALHLPTRDVKMRILARGLPCRGSTCIE